MKNKLIHSMGSARVLLHRYALASGEAGFDLSWRLGNGQRRVLSLGAIPAARAAQMRAHLEARLAADDPSGVLSAFGEGELTLSMLQLGLKARFDPREPVRFRKGAIECIEQLMKQQGDLPLSAVTVSLLASFLRTAEYRSGPQVAKRRAEQLYTAFERACQWGWVQNNPADRFIVSNQQRENRVRFLTLEQVAQIQDWLAGKQARDVVDLMLLTGCRPGEAFALMGQDIERPQNQIHFQMWTNKTLRSRRFPFGRSKPLIVLLEKLSPRVGYPLFADTLGGSKRMDPKVVRREVAAAMGSLGMHGSSLQIFRHTFASHLVMQGVPLLTASTLLGHSSIQTTERYYAHLGANHLADAIASLPYAAAS